MRGSDAYFLGMTQREARVNPSETASIGSYLSYSYLDPLIRLAHKKASLSADDFSAIKEAEEAKFLKDTSYKVSGVTLISEIS